MTGYGFGVTLLPIVDRELRVSARNKATHRLRVLFAVGAVTIGGGLGLLSLAGGGLAGSQLGVWIFEALRWIAFIGACAAGIFLTSDSLSEEKREGTLGLLFLTDLRGHDVVLGKLLATSLRTFYSLLAIFPVMALSFVLGGVAADDFRHTLVSLCNTLFFSLALGMAISVISRDPHKAMTAALGAAVFFLFVIPQMDPLLFGRYPAVPRIGLLSPVFAFTHTSYYHASDFWWSIILVHLAGWCFLAIASWLAPRTWQEKVVRSGLGKGWQFPLFGSAAARFRRGRLLDKNPVCWIISRDRWAANIARLAILLVLGVFALSLASLSQSRSAATPVPLTAVTTASSTTTTSTNGSTIFTYHVSSSSVVWAGGMTANSLYMIASWCASALALALEFWLAAHVCRFYVDGKKNGFLELLLVTPIKPADIIQGHWLALRRLFLAPMATQLLLTLACGAIQVAASYSAVVAPAPGTPAGFYRNMAIPQVLTLGLGAINWCIGLFTIVWFSIWMGLTSKKITIAMLKTFCYAKVLPWFCISFGGGMLFFMLALGMGSFRGGPVWLMGLYSALLQVLFIGANFALIAFARSRAQVAFSKWPNSLSL